jgi:hypothetical protein
MLRKKRQGSDPEKKAERRGIEVRKARCGCGCGEERTRDGEEVEEVRKARCGRRCVRRKRHKEQDAGVEGLDFDVGEGMLNLNVLQVTVISSSLR